MRVVKKPQKSENAFFAVCSNHGGFSRIPKGLSSESLCNAFSKEVGQCFYEQEKVQ